MTKQDYDAIVVGSGPNGLAAAIKLRQEGLSVLLIEGRETAGGGTRTAELTLPGFRHDICSAVHPMAVLSPFFSTLPLDRHGLEWNCPEISAAHPFDDGTAAALFPSLYRTADSLGSDKDRYLKLMGPLTERLHDLLPDLLSPFPSFRHPVQLARFAADALLPATRIAKRFKTDAGKGLWGGVAAHAIQPLSNLITSAIGMILMGASHAGGWPVPKGGAQRIAQALLSYYKSIGGEFRNNFYVRSLAGLPRAGAVLFDVTPRQLLEIAGEALPPFYKHRLRRYRYGMGVFKIDWALSEPVPFTAPECRLAGTVHLGATFGEIARAELLTSQGKIVENPFVIFSQPTVTDSTRAPAGAHVGWAYCHVPHGSEADMTEAIESQVSRFAPGFRDTILARHSFSAREMERYNPNYAGGDINGGIQDIFQHFSRPVLSISPYRTPAKGIYLCSSSTPPGGGVHGMCGYHAAKRALQDLF